MTEEIEAKAKKFDRVPSTIAFPYSDISDAIAVAEGMLKGGGVPMSRDQLAAAMGLAPNGGGFATKISTARLFGVIDSNSGKYQLTDIGFEVVDATRQQEAKVRAFLNVELYKRTYEEFRNRLLPPRPHGLEAAFVNFGVSAKNTKAARLAFEKSARVAGFYPGGNEDRLVMPFGQAAAAAADTISAGSAAENDPPPVQSVTQQAQVSVLHRSILGMLDELPPAKSDWPKAEQADWLQALATMFQVIYKSNDKGEIEVSFNPKIPA